MAVRVEAAYPADPRALAQIRRRVTDMARTAGLGERAVADVALAVSEAATNAIVHGYRGARGVIHVTVECGRSAFTVVVADDGIGPRPRRDSPGLGLGIPLIAGATRRMELSGGEAGTRVRMDFPCPCPAA